MISLAGENGKDLFLAGTEIPAHYFLQAGSIVQMQDGQDVQVGDIVARIPQESSKTRDITGGLPRVAELFEARRPKDPATITEVAEYRLRVLSGPRKALLCVRLPQLCTLGLPRYAATLLAPCCR